MNQPDPRLGPPCCHPDVVARPHQQRQLGQLLVAVPELEQAGDIKESEINPPGVEQR